MLHLLTTTGERPEAFALCVRWMQQQNYRGAATWVIVDDGEVCQQVPAVKDWNIVIARPQPFWRKGQNTQHRNLLAGLVLIPDNARLVIIEDDDHYAPMWLTACHRGLSDTVELFGQSTIRRYHVRSRTHMSNTRNDKSSLHSTACRGSALALLRSIVAKKRKTSIDTDLWHEFTGCKKLTLETHVTAMKGLPGRLGIERTHQSLNGPHDPSWTRLNHWLGSDSHHYKVFK